MEQSVNCTKYNLFTSAGLVRYQLSESSVPNSGDESFAVHLVAESQSDPRAEVDVVYVRAGDAVIQVSNAAFGGVDSDLTLKMLRTAISKLKVLKS